MPEKKLGNVFDIMRLEFPACPICGSSDGYEKSGVSGNYFKCLSCMTKWKLSIENQKITAILLHELPKNGKAICKEENTGKPLFAFVGKPLEPAFWKRLKLTDGIDWKSLSIGTTSEAVNSFVKMQGENALYSWDGQLNIKMDTMSGYSEQGGLILTNRRIVWLKRLTTGTWDKQTSFKITHEILLENIKGIFGESGDSDRWKNTRTLVPIVHDSLESEYGLKYAFLEIFKGITEAAISLRQQEIETEKRKDRVHVTLDFSFLKTLMEKGGLTMQVLKCPECGAAVDFPKSGNVTECSHCGREIYAQDIFEKVKGLI